MPDQTTIIVGAVLIAFLFYITVTTDPKSGKSHLQQWLSLLGV